MLAPAQRLASDMLLETETRRSEGAAERDETTKSNLIYSSGVHLPVNIFSKTCFLLILTSVVVFDASFAHANTGAPPADP